MVVRLGTTGLPRYPAAAGPSAYGAMQLLAPSRTHLRAAHGEFSAGRPPTEPAALVMTPSALDPTIAPAGPAQRERLGAVASLRAVDR